MSKPLRYSKPVAMLAAWVQFLLSTNRTIDKLYIWQIVHLTNCTFDKLCIWQIVHLTNCTFDKSYIQQIQLQLSRRSVSSFILFKKMKCLPKKIQITFLRKISFESVWVFAFFGFLRGILRSSFWLFGLFLYFFQRKLGKNLLHRIKNPTFGKSCCSRTLSPVRFPVKTFFRD